MARNPEEGLPSAFYRAREWTLSFQQQPLLPEKLLQAKGRLERFFCQLGNIYMQLRDGELPETFLSSPHEMTYPLDVLAHGEGVQLFEKGAGSAGVAIDSQGDAWRVEGWPSPPNSPVSTTRQARHIHSGVELRYLRVEDENEEIIERSISREIHRSSLGLLQEIRVVLGDSGGYYVVYKGLDRSTVGVSISNEGKVKRMSKEDLENSEGVTYLF